MRRQISKKEFKGLLKILEDNGFKLLKDISLKGAYAVALGKNIEVIFSGDDIPLIVSVDKHIIPFIGSINYFSNFRVAYVDRGAVRPITNGADVMAPGIKGGEFLEGEYVVVFLESVNTPLAIGKALRNSSSLGEKGKAIKNLHYKGDRIWKLVYGD